MLKRLELVGFKSFADKTIFDFGDGITGIVGPNGSGKSNIVDAVRWILGEQSAKSLRGGEMADVIFNGSTTRRSLGLAEVTMTFDNLGRRLATDAEEVQVTRRVYRSSEGEYLINGQPCRLRDIKELFLGSGAGHDAYCIIEQGKVDVLLQASTKERRTIFEEAAGISRFKAKKIETQRKLERVDQNLSRVKDIIDEVEKQLRSVKLQAAKAQRYQEHSTRLKELRLALGLEEYGQLTSRLETETTALDALRIELDQQAARAGACEAEAERLEMLLADLEDNLRDREADLARIMQEIKTGETTLVHEGSLSADLEAEIDRTRRRLLELTQRLTALVEAAARAHADYTAAQSQVEGQRQNAAQQESELNATIDRLSELHRQVAADQAEHFEQMRRAAHLQNEAVASKAQVDNLRRERDRLRYKSTQAAENLAHIDVELRELVDADQNLQAKLGSARQSLSEHRREREQTLQTRDRTVENISRLRQERSGVASRVEVLEGLIKSHEGLGAGVREMFALIEQTEPGPWSSVLGMIGDFLTVKREYAPLIDLALGDWAQRFIVRDFSGFHQALASRTQPFAGRVSFLPLTSATKPEDDDHALQDLKNTELVEFSPLNRLHEAAAGEPGRDHLGLVAPAEQLVSCDHPELADLPRMLLGRTLIVGDLASARAIAPQVPGFRFITLQGELLDANGTLTIGEFHAEAGILSRKSELNELREQVTRLDYQVVEADRELITLRERLEGLDVLAREGQEEIDVLTEQAADLHARVENHRDRRQGLHEEVEVNRDELVRLDDEVAGLEASLTEAQTQSAAAENQVRVLHERLHRSEAEIRDREQERQLKQQTCTQAQVALAKVEERLMALEAQHRQLEGDLKQRRLEQAQDEAALANSQQRLTDSRLTMLRASAGLAQAALDKETAQAGIAMLIGQRDQKRQERARLAQQAQAVRCEWRAQQEQFHQRELEAANLRHQRDALVERLREDYQVELAELYQNHSKPAGESSSLRGEVVPDSTEPRTLEDSRVGLDVSAANEEIAELRRKLSRLGNVNMEALQELQELEGRATSLQAQFDDLTNAKKSLEEVIAKINDDSRRLFQDSFASIRGHFQELFRKLFGGGMADIVLEDEIDVLESGIEIIARPPGKELRSISLMSGGEKTLTAVALLLAIFRSKPSPFCILDEVDAALDEANIGRYCDVLREFQEQSQFIIVTHSKKTMSAADVLYGITMQESGISKQVAVRIEDWVEEAAQPEAQAS
ncbi:MAG: chromosome segregation protein SMC [Planctomycetes bacterium]|nr:chromosome segregation protein SMC [Planctomycetota bacterium]